MTTWGLIQWQKLCSMMLIMAMPRRALHWFLLNSSLPLRMFMRGGCFYCVKTTVAHWVAVVVALSVCDGCCGGCQ